MFESAITKYVLFNGQNEYFENREDVIKKGAVISIKHHSIIYPILNVVRKVENNRVYFKLPEDFLKNNVLKGDKLQCNILHSNYEYVIYGYINDIETKYPRMVCFAIEKTVKYRNNRKNRRYFVNLQVYVNLEGSTDRVYGIIKNISLSGCSVVLKEEIDDMVDEVNMTIVLEKKNVEFNGKIVRYVSRDVYNEYGIEIIKLTDENQELLQKLISRLEKDEDLYVKECLK